jgi:hypothetical protein
MSLAGSSPWWKAQDVPHGSFSGDINGDDGRHSWPQLGKLAALVEIDPDRNSLDNFGEISGRIICRKKGKLRACTR